MKMLYICVLFVLIFVYHPLTAQLSPIVQAAFEPTYLQNIKETNPSLLKRWTFYAEHSYYLAEYTPEKFNNPLPSIKADPSNINIFLLEKQYPILKRDWHKPLAYRINNTNRVLVYYSGKQFNKAFRKWRAKENNQ